MNIHFSKTISVLTILLITFLWIYSSHNFNDKVELDKSDTKKN